jgi:hypothetical protein
MKLNNQTKTKICKKCFLEKKICEFDKKIGNKDNLNNKCKECRRKYINDYNLKNAEKKRLQQKEYYHRNRDKELIRSSAKHKKFKEQEIDYRKKNRHKINEREKNRYNNDILYRIKTNMRNRLKLFLKTQRVSKINTTLEIVGGSPEIIKEHIEKQFLDGMSWENYGFRGWHIDHIIPLSLAKTKEEIYQLCHYTNLQPLWCEDNLKKGSKLYYETK